MKSHQNYSTIWLALFSLSILDARGVTLYSRYSIVVVNGYGSCCIWHIYFCKHELQCLSLLFCH